MARSTVAVRFTGDANDLKRTVGQVDKGLGGLSTRASKFSSTFKTALSVGAAGAAIKFGKESADAFIEAEEAQKALADAFERFPALADTNQAALQKLNSELQKKTKFDDDAIASGQAVVAQFGITGSQLERLTPLIVDYASRTGKDVPRAAMDVGKAMLGNAKALKNIGIKYTATGDKAKDFENIMGLLSQQVGGFAEKEGTTAAGKVAILGNQFGELQEQVGAKLVPALLKLAEVGLALISWFSSLSPQVQGAIGVVAGLAAALFIIVKAVKAWQAAQLALNVVLTANPIGLVVAAIAAFVAGLVLAYKKVDWFRAFVDKSFALIKGAILAVFNWVKNNWANILTFLGGPIGIAVRVIVTHWDKIKGAAIAVKDFVVDKFGALLSFFRELPGKIGSAMSRLAEILTAPYRIAFRAIRDLWNSTIGGFGFEFGGWDPPGPGSVPGITFRIPRMAKGGVVDSPTLALLGDGQGRMRREIATPEALMRRIVREEGGARGAVPVVIELDGQVLGRAMIRFDADHRARNGRSAFGG